MPSLCSFLYWLERAILSLAVNRNRFLLIRLDASNKETGELMDMYGSDIRWQQRLIICFPILLAIKLSIRESLQAAPALDWATRLHTHNAPSSLILYTYALRGFLKNSRKVVSVGMDFKFPVRTLERHIEPSPLCCATIYHHHHRFPSYIVMIGFDRSIKSLFYSFFDFGILALARRKKTEEETPAAEGIPRNKKGRGNRKIPNRQEAFLPSA